MKFYIIALLFGVLSFNAGCSSISGGETAPVTLSTKVNEQDLQKRMISIKKKIKGGRSEENINYLTKERSNFKGSEQEAEIENLIAQEYFKIEKFSDAGLAYLRGSRVQQTQDRRYKFCLAAARTFYRGSDWDRLKKGIEFCFTNYEIPYENSGELKLMRIQAMEALSAPILEIAKAYVALSKLTTADYGVRGRNSSIKLVDGMSKEALESLISDSEFEFLRGYAAYKLGQIYLGQGDNNSAKSAFEKVILWIPETELAIIAKNKIEQFETVSRVNPMSIGAVLPLSGKHAGIGQKVLRGLQMGLGLDGANRSAIRLAIVDSEGNPDLARKGVEKLVNEDNVVAVVGSLLSKTANAVSDQSQILKVPNISLAQKSGLTLRGENIFRLGITSELQIRYLVKKCMKDLGMKRFAIMYPNDKFGAEYANIFWDEVLARGGEIRGAQTYDPDENDFSGPVQRLVGTFYLEERQEEIRWQAKQIADRQKNRNKKINSDEDTVNAVSDFDAVFVADGIKALGQISAMLSFNGIRGVKIIGPNLWNNESIVKRVTNSGNQIVFVDGAQVDFKNTPNSSFVNDYKTQFGELPGSFEIQGFEVGLVISQVLSENVHSREDFRQSLKSMSPIKGVLGQLRMNEDREITKPLFLYSIENNSIKPFLNQTLK